LLDEEVGASTNLADVVVRFSNQNARYYGNLRMAVSIAAYLTLFSIPISSQTAAITLFGQKEALVGSGAKCDAYSYGLKANVGTDDDPIVVDFTKAQAKENTPVYAWCGYLPGDFIDQWPRIVQVTIFTLYANTGSTVKNAWYCLAGTFLAVANVLFMQLLFPLATADPRYSPVFAWVDLCLVLFLFLTSRCDMVTKMWGLSCTVTTMIVFMNPENPHPVGTRPTGIPGLYIDGEPTLAMITALTGTGIAVLATICPKPLLNINRVQQEAIEVVAGVDMVFKDAIDYYCGTSEEPRRFQIFGRMQALSGTLARVGTNLEASYWETFNLGKYGKIRELYRSFNVAMSRSEDEIYVVRAALAQMDFNEKHAMFAREVRSSLEAIEKDALTCLGLCAKCCMDGEISSVEQQAIRDAVDKMEARQYDLREAFMGAATKVDDYISEEVAADSLFVYSISQWARELQDWALEIADFEEHYARRGSAARTFQYARQRLLWLFDPAYIFSKDTLQTATMNGIPICIVFALSMYAKGSVFIQYSPTMPVTLSLLISADRGAVFLNNLQRLMGVTFGHTLPMLLVSVVGVFGAGLLRTVTHCASIFLFYFAFPFMYYASDKWATIGFLVGGFGCYTLFTPVKAEAGSDFQCAKLYKGIAEVIIAILFKMVGAQVMAPTAPRDLAMQALEDTFKEVQQGFEQFIDGDTGSEQGLKAKVDKAKGLLALCEDWAPKTEPKLDVIPGKRTPFKKPLFESVLVQLRLLVSDLDMLKLALSGHEVEDTMATRISIVQRQDEPDESQEIYCMITQAPSWDVLSKDLLLTVKKSLAVVLAVLRHDSEEAVENDDIEDLNATKNLMELDGLATYYREISKLGSQTKRQTTTAYDELHVTELRRTRITVAVNAMSLATQHTAQMVSQCYEYMLYF